MNYLLHYIAPRTEYTMQKIRIGALLCIKISYDSTDALEREITIYVDNIYLLRNLH